MAHKDTSLKKVSMRFLANVIKLSLLLMNTTLHLFLTLFRFFSRIYFFRFMHEYNEYPLRSYVTDLENYGPFR